MKVLIIDDEPLVRRALKRVAEKKGHQVFEAGDGIAGKDLWSEVQPDIIFLDVLMPGMTGPQVLNVVDKSNQCKVVLMSAYSGEYNLEMAKSIGADIFAPKPFDDIFKIFETAEHLYMSEKI